MIFVVTYFGILFIVAGYTLWRGGAPERWVAGMFVIASIATACVPWSYATSFHHLSFGILAIDTVLCGGLLIVAILADRFWPMWIAALQLVAIGVHGVRALDPHIWALAYWLVLGKLGYPMLGILVAGASRHYHRKRAGFPEYAWSRTRWRDEGALP